VNGYGPGVDFSSELDKVYINTSALTKVNTALLRGIELTHSVCISNSKLLHLKFLFSIAITSGQTQVDLNLISRVWVSFPIPKIQSHVHADLGYSKIVVNEKLKMQKNASLDKPQWGLDFRNGKVDPP